MPTNNVGIWSDRYIGLQALAVGLLAVIVAFLLDHTGHSDVSNAVAFVVGTSGGIIILRKDMLRRVYSWILILALTLLNVFLIIFIIPSKNFNIMAMAPVFVGEIVIFLFAMRHIERMGGPKS